MLRRLDAALIAALQRAYLWVLDYTGIYVGTLMATCMATCAALEFVRYSGSGLWVMVGLDVIIFGGLSQLTWWMQHNRPPEVYNAHASARWTTWPLRIFLVVSVSTAVLWNLLTEPLLYALASVSYGVAVLLLNYLLCVLIRPREPKKLFERERILVPEASGA